MGIAEAAVMMQTISESGGGLAAASSVHMNIFGLEPVVKFGTKEQKDRMLPGLINGTEPPLDKVSKPNQGLSIFYTDFDRTKVQTNEIPKMGRSAVDTNMLFFDKWSIPAEDRIGEEGDGFKMILHGMNAERILLAAEALGLGYAGLRRGAQYAIDRVVFGRQIGQNQSIQHPLADSWMQLEGTHAGLSFRPEGVATAAQEFGVGIPGPASGNSHGVVGDLQVGSEDGDHDTGDMQVDCHAQDLEVGQIMALLHDTPVDSGVGAFAVVSPDSFPYACGSGSVSGPFTLPVTPPTPFDGVDPSSILASTSLAHRKRRLEALMQLPLAVGDFQYVPHETDGQPLQLSSPGPDELSPGAVIQSESLKRRGAPQADSMDSRDGTQMETGVACLDYFAPGAQVVAVSGKPHY
ncbi:hypothetical protein RQP46_011237 [Phenoliferia psychrophenolica]